MWPPPAISLYVHMGQDRRKIALISRMGNTVFGSLTRRPLQHLGLLVGEHFLVTFFERVERAGGDLLGVAFLHIEAPGQGGVHETDVQGEHLNTLVV
jgi:hypothetical protein